MQKSDVKNNDEKKILVFSLQQQELGLSISCVREVLKLQEIHPLPRAPHFIEGVITLRKHIITVFDLRKKLNVPPSGNLALARIIICKVKSFIIGVIVDSVSEVLSLSQKDIQPTPEIVSFQKQGNCFSGIARSGERVIAILDLETILTQEEMNNLTEIRK